MNSSVPTFHSPKSSGGGKTWVVVGAILLLCVGNVYLLSRVNRLQVEQNTLQQKMRMELSQVSESSSLHSGKAKRDFEDLKQEVEAALQENAKFATAEARKETGWLARNVSKKQRAQQEQIMGEVLEVEGVATDAQEKVKEVRGDLDGVKSEVATTQAQLDETNSSLSSTVEQVGAIDGQITAHESQIAHLQKWNERDRVAFSLGKSKSPQRVGHIQMRLRKTDAKRNKYSIEVLADDRKFVKKEKHVNEPVQFYVSGVRRPYEIVVTHVTKDRVIGYLSAPKLRTNRS